MCDHAGRRGEVDRMFPAWVLVFGLTESAVCADAEFAVRVPLARRIPGAFSIATPRAGNRLTDAADLLIADTIDGIPVARCARIRFCPSD